MAKTINWDQNYSSPIKGKIQGGMTFREKMQKAQLSLRSQEEARAEFLIIKPLLKEELLKHMVTRTPIEVTGQIPYTTETFQKSTPEDDKFYNRPQAQPDKLVTVQRVLRPGDTLTFQEYNNTLGHLLFKSSTGDEIEVYTSEMLQIGPGKTMVNQTLLGLLTNTSIYAKVRQSLEEK